VEGVPDSLGSLCELSAVRMRRLIERGEISATELVTAHLDRIAERNPALNAIVTLVPERALAEAARADQAASAGRREEALPPLHGLPVVIKDTHQTAGIRTTFGSRVHSDWVPDADELVVARIRAAGAIVVGKSNVPEFGAGSHTFNSVFGTTLNPHDLTRSAGGSSGGAAAAVAAGLVPLADGSDMGGSLRNPASFCGVVGMRPTPGRVPAVPAGLPFSTLTTQGPIARGVADLALLLSVIAGPDERCPISLADPGAAFAAPAPPAGPVRVAVAVDFDGAVGVDAEVAEGLRPAIEAAKRLGWQVEEACPDLAGAEEAFRTLRALQFATGLGEDYDRQPSLFKASLADNIERGRRLTPAAIGTAERLRGEVYLRAVEFFGSYDVLICPAAQVVPFPASLEYPPAVAGSPVADYLGWMRAAYWVTMMGCPALSLPSGYTTGLSGTMGLSGTAGLPVGAQLVGRPRGDLDLLGIALALEGALPPRRWPAWPPAGPEA
jgi:amidase